MEVRSLAGVAAANEYIFPTTQGSRNHVSDWHSVHNVCEQIEVKNLSLLAAKHMGHSANVNNNIYQAPLSLMEIIKV